MAVDILCCCVCGTDVAGYIAFAAAEYIAVAAAADDAAGCTAVTADGSTAVVAGELRCTWSTRRLLDD